MLSARTGGAQIRLRGTPIGAAWRKPKIIRKIKLTRRFLCWKIPLEQHEWEKLNSVASKLRRLNLAPHAKTISTAAGREPPFTASQPPSSDLPPDGGKSPPDRRTILPSRRAIPPDRRTARPFGGATLPDRRAIPPLGRINLPSGGITLPSRFSRQKHPLSVQLTN